jgi:hypothetical protein
MHAAMSERIAYGRQIQDEATRLLTAFGSSAGRAAEEWSNCAGLTQGDEAFRRAVLDRVMRLLGERASDSRAA